MSMDTPLLLIAWPCLGVSRAISCFFKQQVMNPKRVRDQFRLAPGQQLQVLALPGRIELVPSKPPAALRGFLQGDNTFQREPDRL